MTRSGFLFAVGVLFLGGAGSASAQVPAAYGIEDLGSFGGQALVGMAINANGDVAGYGDLPDGTYHAFRWTRAGGLEDLGANGEWFAQAFGINDNGDVVGVYMDANFNQHGFIAPRGGVMQDLLTYERPIQFAASITNDGRLAGSIASFTSLARSHGFRTVADGSVQDLGSGDRTSDAADINDAGDVTGTEWHSTSVFDPITAYRYPTHTEKSTSVPSAVSTAAVCRSTTAASSLDGRRTRTMSAMRFARALACRWRTSGCSAVRSRRAGPRRSTTTAPSSATRRGHPAGPRSFTRTPAA